MTRIEKYKKLRKHIALLNLRHIQRKKSPVKAIRKKEQLLECGLNYHLKHNKEYKHARMKDKHTLKELREILEND